MKKADGSLEIFDGSKIIKTCLRSGLDNEESGIVLQHVERKAYDKIPTNALLKMILKEIRKHSKPAAMKYNLRAALAALSPEGVFFEVYIKKLLEEYGYSVEHSKIVKGNCSEHEVDLIAKKGNEKIMVECKHHRNHHTFAGQAEAMVTWAKFDDTKGRNGFTGAWLVCNTKISAHAMGYLACKNLKSVCWGNGLNGMIEGKKLYPVTILGSMAGNSVEKAFNSGVLTIEDVISADSAVLRKVFGEKRLRAVEEARSILYS
ncbi:MAG: restriction endonuclease [Candidatus Aenigmarchaeota archaeon]|nr:restriction endonuclease [Candidatus Aenigmarchaeota archaeon]